MVLYNLFPEKDYTKSGPLLKGKVHTRVCSRLEITETILGLLGRDSCSKTEKGKKSYSGLLDHEIFLALKKILDMADIKCVSCL